MSHIREEAEKVISANQHSLTTNYKPQGDLHERIEHSALHLAAYVSGVMWHSPPDRQQ